MNKYRGVTWNIPWDVYERLRDQVDRYRKFGTHPNISEQEYAIATLARGLSIHDRELTQMSAPHIVLPDGGEAAGYSRPNLGPLPQETRKQPASKARPPKR